MSVDRPLPHASEAELALLCAALIAPDAVLTEVADVTPEHFYDNRAQQLWKIIRTLRTEGKAVDPVTIAGRFPEQDGDELQAFLSTVVSSQGLSASARDYADAIRETHRRRELIGLAYLTIKGAHDKSADVDYMTREVIRQLNASAPTRRAVEIVSAADLLARNFPDADDIVAGILQHRGRAIVSGPAKLGKTRFTLGLCLAVATGKPAMSFQATNPARVLYLQAEVSERALQDRLQKMLTGFDADESALRERLLFHNAPGLKLTNPAHVEAIRQAVELHKPDLLAIDPLYKFQNGDESSVKDMTAFLDPLDAMIADYGLSVLLVHHHGKGSGDGLQTPAHRNRGSSTIADWADSLLTLTFEDADAGIVKLTYTLRNAEEPEPMAFQRNPDTLWFDPLPEYQFSGKACAARITPQDVAAIIGTGRAVEYTRLAEQLAERFNVTPRTGKTAITRANEAGTIRKNEDGLYEAV